MKKTFAILIPSFFMFHICYAEHQVTCPSAAAVRQLQYDHQRWEAYTIDNGTPIPVKELPAFVEHLSDNKLAESVQDAPEGASHCYYGDTDLDWAPFFLATTRELLPIGQNWHYLSDGIWQCAYRSRQDCWWREVTSH